jgi:hypothetical protein
MLSDALFLSRHAVSVADHSDVHGVVLLGVPRESTRRYRLSLDVCRAGRPGPCLRTEAQLQIIILRLIVQDQIQS